MERWTPWVLAGFGIVVSLWLHHLGYLAHFMKAESLVDAMVTFASIIVGFVGVLLGILMSIKNDAAVAELFRSKGRKVLRVYFREAIISGMLLVVVSAILGLGTYLDMVIPHSGAYSPSTVLLVIWMGLSIYVFPANYRIVSVMMYIIFHSDENENKKPDPMVMDEKEKEALKSQFRKPQVGDTSEP